jgi:hypothetical protein
MNAPKLQRVAFVHAGRKYVAIRFRGGRVELYWVDPSDGIEMFLRYARPSRANVDRKAIRMLSDVLDPAACEAGAVLRGAYGDKVRNVRVLSSPACGPFGTLVFERLYPWRSVWKQEQCSIRLYSEVKPCTQGLAKEVRS